MSPSIDIDGQTPPFRAEHIGSYLRSSSLLQRRKDFAAKLCTYEELRAVEDESIKHVVQLQRQAGIKSITDGEQRRFAFYDGVFENLGGVFPVDDFPLKDTNSFIPYLSAMMDMGLQSMPTLICKDKLKRTRGFYVDDFKYLKTLLRPEEIPYAKVTMCPPEWLHLRHGSERTYDKLVYSNDEEYFKDLAKVYQEEIHELHELGCRNIQFDCPTLAFFCADGIEHGFSAAGINMQELLDKYISLINDCLRDKPVDMCVGIHLCRGNMNGFSFCSGGYDRISEKLFNNLNVKCYYLEYDNDRAGSFEVLKHLPLNKKVVLGIVTTKTAELESVDTMIERVNEAVGILCDGTVPRSRDVALSQICVSTQCGFASQFEGNPINEEDEKQKLALVTEIVNRMWQNI